MRTLLISAALLVATSSSFATLGGQPTASNDSRAVATEMRAQVRATAQAYTQHQVSSPNGQRFTEYVSDAGVVFAVTWHGPAQPNLRELLGAGYDAYVAKTSANPGATHSHMALKQDDLVIAATGHMRAFEGHAWIPSLLPAGFTTADLN